MHSFVRDDGFIFLSTSHAFNISRLHMPSYEGAAVTLPVEDLATPFFLVHPVP